MASCIAPGGFAVVWLLRDDAASLPVTFVVGSGVPWVLSSLTCPGSWKSAVTGWFARSGEKRAILDATGVDDPEIACASVELADDRPLLGKVALGVAVTARSGQVSRSGLRRARVWFSSRLGARRPHEGLPMQNESSAYRSRSDGEVPSSSGYSRLARTTRSFVFDERAAALVLGHTPATASVCVDRPPHVRRGRAA